MQQRVDRDGGEVGPAARAPLSRTSLLKQGQLPGHRPAPSLTSHRPPSLTPSFSKMKSSSASQQESNYRRGSSGLRCQAQQTPHEPPQDEQSRRRLWSRLYSRSKCPWSSEAPAAPRDQLQMGEGAMVGAPALGQGLSGDPNRPGLLPPSIHKLTNSEILPTSSLDSQETPDAFSAACSSELQLKLLHRPKSSLRFPP